MNEGWVEREGVRLHYVEWAPTQESRDPVFFLHGLSSNARFWDRVAARLPDRRLVALDQRSHGRSDQPPVGYTHETLVADAALVLEELGLRRALVAGHSWGAAIGLELAAARPDLVAGLAFIDGPAGSMSEVLSWEEAQKMMQPELPRFANLEEAALRKRKDLEWEPSWGEDLLPYVEAGLTATDGGYRLTLTEPVRFEILRELFHYHPEMLWGSLEGPVAVLMAESDSPIGLWKRRAEAAIKQLRPDADVGWYRAPHDLPLHLPDEIAAAVERLSIRAALAGFAREVARLEGDWGRPTAAEGWSAHDLLAHISSTQAALAATVESATAATGGSAREAFDPDRWNAGQVRRRRELAAADLVTEVAQGSARADASLRVADLARPVAIGSFAGRPLAEAMWALVAHQRGHLAELRTALIPT